MGSAGAGGGSTSGKVDYPGYVKKVHGDWLAGYKNAADTDPEPVAFIDMNITEAMNEALASNPFSGAAAYDPTTDLDAIDASAALLQGLVTAMSSAGDWATYFAAAIAAIDHQFLEGAYLDAEIVAYNAEVDNEITTKVLPRFQRGMQDINAVLSSSFVIGQAHIEAEGERQKARFSSQLRLQNWKDRNAAAITSTEQMVRLLIGKVNYQQATAQLVLDGKKSRIIAEKEYITDGLKIAEDSATWYIELFQHGANLIAAPHGGVVQTTKSAKPSGIGTALSVGGAALGLGAAMLPIFA